MLQILAATSNKHKVEEFKSALSQLLPDLQILMTGDIASFPEAEENGTTFEENAMIKAKAVYKALHDESLVVIADDSGLCVDALDGAPGIYRRGRKA